MGIFGRRKISTDTSHTGCGTFGKGMKEAYAKGCQFDMELKQIGIDYNPYRYMSPDTAARKKNALSLREFRAAREEIGNLLGDFFAGTVHARSAFALGGGTANFGIQSLPMISKFTEYTTAQVVLSHELFSAKLANDEKLRRFINTETQLAQIGQIIERHPISVEIISIQDCIETFGNSYDLIDVGIHECMSLFNGISSFNSHFDTEDVISDRRFKARTFGYDRFPLVKRFEPNIARIYDACQRLTPLFKLEYFSKDNSIDVIGPPLIILAGPRELVDDAQSRFGSSHNQNCSLDEIEKTFGSMAAVGLAPTYISYPLSGLSHIYILAIYPVDFNWLKKQCQEAKELILDLNGKVVKGQTDSALAKVYQLMLGQVGNPDITEFIGG